MEPLPMLPARLDVQSKLMEDVLISVVKSLPDLIGKRSSRVRCVLYQQLSEQLLIIFSKQCIDIIERDDLPPITGHAY